MLLMILQRKMTSCNVVFSRRQRGRVIILFSEKEYLMKCCFLFCRKRPYAMSFFLRKERGPYAVSSFAQGKRTLLNFVSVVVAVVVVAVVVVVVVGFTEKENLMECRLF